MDTASKFKKLRILGEKFLAGVTLLGAVLGAVGTFWGRHVITQTVRSIPNPPIPSPNAFDYYVKASDSIVDGDKVDHANVPSTHPAGKGPERIDTLAEKATLVQENAGAVKILRQGFAYPYLSPPGRSINDKFPYWASERRMGRLLELQGEVEAAHGDWNGATQSGLDSVQTGVQIPHGAVILGGLVGIACQSLGRREVWPAVSHLNTQQAWAAAWRLERLQRLQVPVSETLRQEKWMGSAVMVEMSRKGDPGTEGFYGLGISDYTRYMDQCIAGLRLPYAARPPPPALPRDVICAIVCPVFMGASLRYTDNAAQNALLTASLALRAYRLEHGTYPPNLQALVPGYLSRVPDDPFALSGQLRYRPQGATYLLYSVGPDGKDDGGRAIFDAKAAAPRSAAAFDLRRTTRADSRGDIVAGVNTR